MSLSADSVNSYQDALMLLEEIGYKPRESEISINPMAIISGEEMISQYDYYKAVSIIDGSAPRTAQPAQSNTVGSVAQLEKPRPKISGFGEMLKVKEKDHGKKPQSQAAPAETASPAPRPMPRMHVKEEISSAISELKKLTPEVGKKMSEVKEKRYKEPRASHVMETLSIQDQISELEKISAGIDQRVFNEEQYLIIRDEVANLIRVALKQKPKKETEGIMELRNSRLLEVRKKLGI